MDRYSNIGPLSNHIPMKEYIQLINDHLKQNRLSEAINLSSKILQQDPENTTITRLFNKAQKLLEQQNTRIVDQKITTIKPLIAKSLFKEALKQLQELLNYTPNHQKLHSLIQEVQAQYHQQQQNLATDFIQQTLSQLQIAIQNNDDTQFFSQEALVHKFLENAPSLRAKLIDLRHQLIDQKLQAKEEFLNSDKFEQILEFITELQKIEPEYQNLKELQTAIKNRYLLQKENQEKEYIFQGNENIKTLYQKEKYDKAITAAKEILAFDKGNKQAKNLLQKSINKQNKEMNTEVASKIKQNFPDLQKKTTSRSKAIHYPLKKR